MEKIICSAAELPQAACKTSPPVAQRDQIPDQEEARKVSEKNHPANGEGPCEHVVPRILLVSNDDYFRPMVRAYLEHVGFAVISCADARRAPEIASSTPNLSLLLLDLSSSGQEELQVALELEEIRAGMPAVIMSGCGLTDDEIEMVGHHPWRLLRKPLQLPELLAVIRQVFDRSKLGPNASAPGKLPGTAKVMRFPARDAQRSAIGASASPSNRMALVWRKAQGDHRRA